MAKVFPNSTMLFELRPDRAFSYGFLTTCYDCVMIHERSFNNETKKNFVAAFVTRMLILNLLFYRFYVLIKVI